MASSRIEQKRVDTYTRVLLEAAKSAGREARDLEEWKSILKLSPEVLAMLSAMQDEGDIGMLPKVCDEYESLLSVGDATVPVEVTTAVELDDHLREVIFRKLEADFGGPVYLVEKVDPSILGGIILEARGQRRDASVRAQLVGIRKTLSSAFIGGDNQ